MGGSAFVCSTVRKTLIAQILHYLPQLLQVVSPRATSSFFSGLLVEFEDEASGSWNPPDE